MFAGTETFLRFEADLDFSRPRFSEIKVQIKRAIIMTKRFYVANVIFLHFQALGSFAIIEKKTEMN